MTPVRVWAPAAMTVDLVLDRRIEMVRQPDGWWRGPDLPPRTDYAFSVDGGPPRPDPRSRHQPVGVHARSRVIAPAPPRTRFVASPLSDAIIYELHVGTFSRTGDFDGAIAGLDHLARLGITHVEIMPVAAFPGNDGWGYDGVLPFSVHDPYGGPSGLDRFVNACHARSLATIVDVVHNHLGPEGNYLETFAPYHRSDRSSPWGSALDFDCREVRRYFIDSAIALLEEHDVDGLRLDAVHAIQDTSRPHFVEELAAEVRALGNRTGRPRVLIAEYDAHEPHIVQPTREQGWGIDAHWNDDFHHALHVLLTGERTGYYTDFAEPNALARVFENGYHLDGKYSTFRRAHHGAPYGDLPRDRLVAYTQSHDQIGNRSGGERLSTLAGIKRAKIAAALLLTSPFVPMVFQGEEWAASTPFVYFADFKDEHLRDAIREGRRREHGGHDTFDPFAMSTRQACMLDWRERDHGVHREMLAWYRDLIALRREHGELRASGPLDTRATQAEDAVTIDRGCFQVIANLGGRDISIPQGEVVLASCPLEAGRLPPESCAITRVAGAR